jgi:transcriptional regulator with XRE-family HTH domain
VEENIKLKIGKNIKKIRNKLGYTQEKLSEISEIDYKYIQKIEGKKPPALKIDTIERIAKALKVSPTKLLDF